jgi:hypothetical protein
MPLDRIINETRPTMKSSIELRSLASPGWFREFATSKIWLTAIRSLLVDTLQMEGHIVHEFENARISIVHGEIRFPDRHPLSLHFSNEGHLVAAPVTTHAIERVGAWILIAQPYAIDGHQVDEAVVRNRASQFIGIYGAVNGRNMVYEKVFEGAVEMADGNIEMVSPVFENPHASPRPDFSMKKLDQIRHAITCIESKPLGERQRIELALHWHEKALYSMGIDGFVNHWVALETIGMPNTTNIRPINESLARAYDVPLDKAVSRFGVGKIFGLRSRILHGGENLPIHGDLTAYMESLFSDVLFEKLEMPSDKHAGLLLERENFDIRRLTYASV